MRCFHKKNKWVKYVTAIPFILLLTTGRLFSQTVIKASDFGVHANSFENAATGMQNAINACRTNDSSILLLPGGRIDIWPDGAEKRELYISNCTEDDTLSKVKNIAFLFEGDKNITLEGNNTLVILHGKMISFAILNSRNINIRNVSFDYERPTMSELTIKSVATNVIETEIHRDSKYTIDSGRICFYGEGWKTKSYHTILFDPNKNTLQYSSFESFLKATAIETSPFKVRFEGNFASSPVKPGDVLTIRDPYRDNCGGFISLSQNIQLYNVEMHYMHGLGIVSQFSKNISLLKVLVAPGENSDRVIAAFADCFHFSGCRGLITIDSCLTSGSHDDPVNVHGTHLQIVDIDTAKRIRVHFMHPQTYGFEAFFPGDSIAFINPQTLLPLGVAKLKSATLINKREMELVVDGSLPGSIISGLCVENLTWTPEIIIRNSRFERTDTRGLLITTRRKVLIENNIFYHTGMYPILIADDALSWFESGAVRDVLIRNNIFDGCGYNTASGAINIAPENRELIAGKAVHQNIRITDNTFKVINKDVLDARSVDHLLFSGNKIIDSSSEKSETGDLSVHLVACQHVLIERNMSDSHKPSFVYIAKMKRNDIKTDWKIGIMNN
jgi:hypothetical protein